MNADAIEAHINEYARIIDDGLMRYLPKEETLYKSVCDAMRYSALAGGKRIRPLLLLEFFAICSGNRDFENVLPFACAVEMIHTYSLIHDDLPCMDDDDLRRGKPSCHIAFGEATALLAGDALLSLAFETALCNNYKDTAKPSVLPDNVLRATYTLAKASGVHGMVGGQVIDLESEGKEITLDILETMHRKKTGEMIIAPAKMGTILAGAGEEFIQASSEYAQKIGLAFQIVDDILDFTSDDQKLGKPVGSDREMQKSTYVTVLGLEKSKELKDRLTDEAVQSLRIFGQKGEFLSGLAYFLAGRDK